MMDLKLKCRVTHIVGQKLWKFWCGLRPEWAIIWLKSVLCWIAWTLRFGYVLEMSWEATSEPKRRGTRVLSRILNEGLPEAVRKSECGVLMMRRNEGNWENNSLHIYFLCQIQKLYLIMFSVSVSLVISISASHTDSRGCMGTKRIRHTIRDLQNTFFPEVLLNE